MMGNTSDGGHTLPWTPASVGVNNTDQSQVCIEYGLSGYPFLRAEEGHDLGR